MTAPAISTPPVVPAGGAPQLRLVPAPAPDCPDSAAIRDRLTAVLAELDRSLAVLDGTHARHPLVADYPQDPADAGTNLAESDRAEAILAAARARRALVLEALGRLDDGSYGACVDCGHEVPPGRLEAKPEAARCLTCQAKRDRLRR